MPTQPIKSIQHIDFDAHPVKLLLPADLETLQKAHVDIYIYIMYMYADIPCTTGFKCPRFPHASKFRAFQNQMAQSPPTEPTGRNSNGNHEIEPSYKWDT